MAFPYREIRISLHYVLGQKWPHSFVIRLRTASDINYLMTGYMIYLFCFDCCAQFGHDESPTRLTRRCNFVQASVAKSLRTATEEPTALPNRSHNRLDVAQTI